MIDGLPTGAIVTLALLAIILLLIAVVWSIKRHRDPTIHVDCDAPIGELVHSLAGITLGTALDGNAVDVHENGAFFDVMLEEVRNARRTLHFETFLWKEGVLGNRLAEALAERARAGVKVRVLLDAVGCKKIGEAAERTMRDAGCCVVRFRKHGIHNIGVFNERDHRKLLVADGKVALVGGHCIVDHWLGEAQDSDHYADISVRVRGPIVNSVQSAFSENWVGETGELIVGADVFPEPERAGDVIMYAAYVKPEGSPPAVKLFHHTMLCLARERIWIQNPYFIAEPDAIEAFGKAVERGVDVRVLMPATSGSDNPMVQHAGHRNFERLLKLGVRLFEYPDTLLHQKVMTVDSLWCAVGSSNFDDRSFEINDEIVLGFIDAASARKLDAIFEKWAAKSNEIKLEAWRRRGLWHRFKDEVFYLANEVF